VEATASVASNILEDVKRSSEAMDHTVSVCLEDFSGYLNQQGDQLKQELGSHFTSLQSFLSSQATEVQQVTQQNGTFLEHSRGNILPHTGATPEKKPMKELREICSTRDHQLIKEEVRSGERERGSCKRSLESAYGETEEGDRDNREGGDRDVKEEGSVPCSPQKSSRDKLSNGSVHSGRALSFDSQSSNSNESSERATAASDETENAEPQNAIEQEQSTEPVKGAAVTTTSSSSMLPKLTRARSAKLKPSIR
jgi:hypothetical protein